jgi:hypothetical protein
MTTRTTGRILVIDNCRRAAPTCSADPFPKWKWMMDYCKINGMSPTLGWESAEKAWRDKSEPNAEHDGRQEGTQ